MPGEGPEEDYDEVEEVEEEAPKVRPGRVADERNAALKGKLGPWASSRLFGELQALISALLPRGLSGDRTEMGGGVCQQLSYQVLWSGRRKGSCRLLYPGWLF